MWWYWSPSLETASSVASWANVALIISLVGGVVATVLIVWMGNIKEEYWDAARRASNERIAALTTSADEARASIATAQSEAAQANERAAEAGKKAEEEKLARLKLEAGLAPRRLSSTQRQKLIEVLSKTPHAPCAVVSRMTDVEGGDFASDIEGALKAAGWLVAFNTSMWTQRAKGLMAGRIGTDRALGTNELIAAFAAIGIKVDDAKIEVAQKNFIPQEFQPGILYVLVGAKP